jgi:hypothetical protein
MHQPAGSPAGMGPAQLAHPRLNLSRQLPQMKIRDATDQSAPANRLGGTTQPGMLAGDPWSWEPRCRRQHHQLNRGPAPAQTLQHRTGGHPISDIGETFGRVLAFGPHCRS